MGEARRKKLAALRKRFLPPAPEPEVEYGDIRAKTRDQLASWMATRIDDLMFKELLK